MMHVALAFMMICAGCSKSGGPESCPDPSDPRVHYVEGTREDPARCQTIRFVCESQDGFNNECGCGCIDFN